MLKCEQYKYSSSGERRRGGEAAKDLKGAAEIFVFMSSLLWNRISVSEHLLQCSWKCQPFNYRLNLQATFSILILWSCFSQARETKLKNKLLCSQMMLRHLPVTPRRCRIVTQQAWPPGFSSLFLPLSALPLYLSISLSLYRKNTAHHILIMPSNRRHFSN